MKLNPQQQFAKEIQETLDSMNFPLEQIPEAFGVWLAIAMESESLRTLNCGFPIMEALHTLPPAELNMSQMGVALNSIESKTPEQLRMTPGGYLNVQKSVAKMAVIWNEIVNPIKQNIQRRIETQHRIATGVPVSQTKKFEA